MTPEQHTIVIIDDARSSRDSLVAMVESLGHRAFAADSGMGGLRLVAELRPSLVLLDVVMPQFDGYKIAAAIKAQAGYVPVILLTALNDVESKRRGQAAGADDFLSKPISPPELQIRIAAMLRIKSLTDALDAANRRLNELAVTDGLTGISNRRKIEESLNAELERARRYRRPLALLLLDIDHFKNINDAHGHAVGDVVLKAVARGLTATIRQSDYVGRWGGEEFCVVAPEVDSGGAAALGERLRRHTETHGGGDSGVSATISIGAASWNGHGVLAPEIMLKCADDALYRAKAEGRNRVILETVAGTVKQT